MSAKMNEKMNQKISDKISDKTNNKKSYFPNNGNAPGAGPPGQPGTDYQPLIFVAEDNPKNLQVVYNILKDEGFRIAAAGDGAKALQMIPRTKPDLVLLDIMMPELTGFQVIEQLKEIPGIKDIPVIFITALADIEEIVKGFGLGAVDYITKPFKAEELISRVKTHVELKLARQRLHQLNATKDKLFSIIAHDVRNPLQNLLMSANLLDDNYDAFDETKRKEYIHKFRLTSDLVSALIENLLQWALSQQGGLKLRRRKINLTELTAENLPLAKEQADKKQIRLMATVTADITAYVDADMISAVLRNLLSNAVKFTPPGGTVELDVSIKGKAVEIRVTDTGIGIDEADIPNLFQLGDQKISLGTANEKGTGLGLILCKEFVEINNGSIAVESQPGKGSTFIVTLPSAP